MISKWLENDRAVNFAIAARVWSLPAGLITVLLIGFSFSPEAQGYYYTFNAVLSIQLFAELGLSTVLIYFASHEWSKLRVGPDGRPTGDDVALSRLTSLARFALKWYVIAAVALTLLLAFGGLRFLATAGSQDFSWKAPWLALCIATGLAFSTVPVWSLLEGCNQVSHTYAYRFVQAVVTSITAWIAIWNNAELWFVSISLSIGLLFALAMIVCRYSDFLSTIMLRTPRGPRVSWRTDLLPMQWRIALSWIAGYFVFFLLTPVLFFYQGPVVAGQMGMTWSFASALLAVASSWVTPKAPSFGILIAQRKFDELDRLFWKITATVLVVTLLGALAIWAAVFILNLLHHPFAGRLLSPASTGFLLLATVLTAASIPMSTYLRAHKQEPLLKVSLLSGVITGIVILIMGKYYSAFGVSIGYLVATAATTPFIAMIWRQKRSEWHARGEENVCQDVPQDNVTERKS